MPTCTSCGRESPADFAFCPDCGASLTDRPLREVRKTVTVVFCDVSGSTSLGEKLDPESLRKVMARYFDEMRIALERHGGTVEKFIGDAVMAVFGIPQVREDDALRGVRAAADMRESLQRLNEQLERDSGITLTARIGVNTGEVVAGDHASAERLVTGDAVNVAARLEQAASPGEVLLGDATYRLVLEMVEAEPLAALDVKGKGEPVPAHRLVRVFTEPHGRVRRLDSPMIGRDRELGLLTQAFDRAVSDQACQLLTILGPAGMGKSRLLDEFLPSAAGATVLRGRCLSYGEGITYFPLVEVVKQASGLTDFDDPEVVETKVCALLKDVERREIVCSRVAQLLGLTEAAAPEETLWAIRTFLEALARDQPLVLVFDDVHWGAPTFLDLVEHVADLSRDVPILLVCMARPDLLDARPGWAGGKPNAATISLEPLSHPECEALIQNLLRSAEVPEEVRQKISDAADGNPLFVEEMLAMLIDDGLLAPQDGGWAPKRDLTDVAVPPTITALLAARLDRLALPERALIERAAVVGKVFYKDALLALSDDDDPKEIDALLTSLLRKEVVRRERSTLPGEESFRFRHILFRDAAYRVIPKEARATLHERFADWLVQVAGDRVAEQEEIVGHHLEQAYRLRTELAPPDERIADLAERAGERLAQAGLRAVDRGDAPGATALLGRAVELLPPGNASRPEALDEAGFAAFLMGDLDRAMILFELMGDEARALGDRRNEALGEINRSTGRFLSDPTSTSVEEMRAIAEGALGVFEELGDQEGQARACTRLSDVCWTAGDAGTARSAAERAIGHCLRAKRSRGDLSAAVVHLGEALYLGRTPAREALDRMETLLPQVELNRRAHTQALTYHARFLALLGRSTESRKESARCQEISDDLGDPWGVYGSMSERGLVEWLSGDREAAEPLMRPFYLHAKEAGDVTNQVLMGSDLARLLSELRRDAEVLALTEEVSGLAAPYDVQLQIQWRAARSAALARSGALDEAYALSEEAERIARGTDFLTVLADTLMSKAEVLRVAARNEEATQAAEEALALWERKEFRVLADRARSLLGQVS